MATTTNLELNKIEPEDYVDLDPINKNWDKIDQLGVDYVIEQGKSGEWWYRKWKSGRAECGIDQKTFADMTSYKWGALYRVGPYKFPNFPITFSSPPISNIMYRSDNNNYGGILHVHPWYGTQALTAPPSFSIADPLGPHTYKSPVCGIFVTGTWK